MTCRFPLAAARRVGSSDKPLVYGAGERPEPLAPGWEALDLPCGQCRSCRLEYSRRWAVRLMHEAAYWEEVHGIYPFFLTLTYDDEHLPMYGSLVKHHIQDFLKNLRWKSGAKLRYYIVGEYGSTCPDHKVIDCPICGPIQRPHYHGIIFGWSPPDKEVLGHRDGGTVFCSELIDDAWAKGSHEFGSCTFESCAYVARYVMKKQTGKEAADYYRRFVHELCELVEITPEFAVMSRGGNSPDGEQMRGIGYPWFERYKDDLYPSDETPIPGRGVVGKPPRYYDSLYEVEYPEVLAEVKAERLEALRKSLESGPSLASRALVEDARLALLYRS